MKKKPAKKHFSWSKRIGPIVIVLAVAAIAIGIGIDRHGKTKTPAVQAVDQAGVIATQSKDSPAPAPNTVVTSPTPTPNPNVPGGSTGSSVGSTATLTAPNGTFVNNHGQDSSYPVSGSTTELSNCTTTPGASCDITFTSAGTTKSLGAKQTSENSSSNLPAGSASWTWTPNGIGLTTGTWKITAVATLNGQSKTTTDQVNLTVQ